MTREDAISILERVAHTESKWPGTEDTLEALDMAISALRKQDHFREVTKKVEPMTNADRIRSMTDDELNELFHEIYNAGAEDAVAYEWGQRTNSFEWTMKWLQQPD